MAQNQQKNEDTEAAAGAALDDAGGAGGLSDVEIRLRACEVVTRHRTKMRVEAIAAEASHIFNYVTGRTGAGER